MIKKAMAAVLALSFVTLATLATDAAAKRRCPRGFDDDVIPNVCTPK